MENWEGVVQAEEKERFRKKEGVDKVTLQRCHA